MLTNVSLLTFVRMETKVKNGRKQQIEQTATMLFQKKGYAATSMRDLAAELGIEAASIYSHVKSKEEILQRICFRMAEEFFDSLKSNLANCDNAEDRLKMAIISHVKVVTKDPASSAVFFSEWRHMGAEALNDFLQMREDYEKEFKSILSGGIENGIFREVDINLSMMSILSSINFIPAWYKVNGKYSAEEIAERISRQFIDGIKN